MLASCGAADGQADAECAQEAEAAYQACLAGCEGQPPPPDDCFTACQRRFDDFLNQCLVGVDPATGDVQGDPGQQQHAAEREPGEHRAGELARALRGVDHADRALGCPAQFGVGLSEGAVVAVGALVGTAVNLTMSSLIAYPLSRKRLPLRKSFIE